MMARYFQLFKNGKEADIYIFGDIVTSQWFDDETSADSFRKAVNESGADVLNVHIDSYGGAVSEGWAIYNVLKDFPGTVNTYADGFVASAAVYPFLAGAQRVANPMSAFFLHQVWMSAAGNADELRKAADDAEKFNEIGLEAFGALGIDKDKILELEKAETWLSASEALELGIATEIQDRSGEDKQMQSVRGMILNALMAKPEQTAPEAVAAPETVDNPVEEAEPKQVVDNQTEEVKNHLREFFKKAAENTK